MEIHHNLFASLSMNTLLKPLAFCSNLHCSSTEYDGCGKVTLGHVPRLVRSISFTTMGKQEMLTEPYY